MSAQKKHIAIIGTRGIPNNYGGFEQLAEYLSVSLTQKGLRVTVYNSSLHPYKNNSYNGVEIVTCYDPENKIGTVGQFIYDLNCILDCRKKKYDVILQLGYTSSSVWSFLFPKNAKIITNMDGLEWKRSKYNQLTKYFLSIAEKWAVNNSHTLIADSLGIQDYLSKKYNKPSTYIAYGASVFNTPNETVLKKYDLTVQQYFTVIARLEPENNIETIIKGYLKSNSKHPLIIIGGTTTKLGTYLVNSYKHTNIKFLGSLYNIDVLNNIRYHSKLYFHGHSVGGTNPSLLEAMASQVLICAHQNIFNQSVLSNNAFYFNDEEDIIKIFNQEIDSKTKKLYINDNLQKIEQQFSWESINNAYYQVITNA